MRVMRLWPYSLPCLALSIVFFARLASAQSIAFTFDDGPDMTDRVGMTSGERNAAILKQLDDAHVKSVLFVTRTDTDPERVELIRQWGDDGHLVANHTATHLDLDEVTLAAFERDFLACDAAIRAFPGFTRLFRFPYLKEGDTLQKRDGFRAFLASKDYRIGAVSVDTSDWYYSQRLRSRMQKRPKGDLSAFRKAYLDHLYDRATYYDALSRRVLGRSVQHVMLLHHNLTSALFLGDAIRMFRDKGWQVIDAKTAFEDPVYQIKPNILPAGESVLWALAKEKGVPALRWPGEDDRYEKPILDRLHL